MTRRTLGLLALTMAIALGITSQAAAQTPIATKYEGTITDYVQALGATWLISGTWSIQLKGPSGKGEFSAALSMVNPAAPDSPAHTHHVTLAEGEVDIDDDWELGPERFTVSGLAHITGNGGAPMYFESPITVAITGGTVLTYSNVSLTFQEGATTHFGATSLAGVVKSAGSGK